MSDAPGSPAAHGDMWPAGPRQIGAVTLFVEDLAAARQFYVEVFELPVHFEDADSVVFRFGGTLVNLLDVSAAADLVEADRVGGSDAGTRSQFTIEVGDVDVVCAELQRRGVNLLSGPLDRPWGVRTASFADPGGHIWEIAADVR